MIAMLVAGAMAATERGGGQRAQSQPRASAASPAPAAQPSGGAAAGGAALRRDAGSAAVSSRTAAATRAAVIAAPATRRTAVAARSATTSGPGQKQASGGAAARRGAGSATARAAATVARAAAEDAIAESPGAYAAAPGVSTRTGAAYEKCKSSYFTCMDQFCAVKNEKYRRCSCSDKIYDLDEQQQVLESAAEKINEFNAGIDAVGMTAAQAGAMRQASEGELAMTADNSNSKRILNAIMNSISGSGETKIGGGGLEKLNSVSFDGGSSMLGADSNGQALASYDGKTLYSAIYAQCRGVVRPNCTDDALQRAVTAYLMAVENDCATVSKMIGDNRKKMTAAVRESGAMMELARIDNRKNHNSSDAVECINAVETAILDEQVCGANYKKCLDNGEFIDKDTGDPFTGVTNFNELTSLLKFDESADIGSQKLTAISSNKQFVQNFVARNKKFAEPALDKCVEIADEVWSTYLDKAMIEIHYAQIAKVEEIKTGCFDIIHECYVSGRKSVTDFMKNIPNANDVLAKPSTVSLTSKLCEEYTQSCDALFGGDFVSGYIRTIDDKDITTMCRNVVKTCFESYGGDNYSNFYNPASGLFAPGSALDWFTLYEYEIEKVNVPATTNKYADSLTKKGEEPVSKCAKQVNSIQECVPHLQQVFGGFDRGPDFKSNSNIQSYGRFSADDKLSYINIINTRNMYNTGVATEIYNLIIGNLRVQCQNYNGYFLEINKIDKESFCVEEKSTGKCANKTSCYSNFKESSLYTSLTESYRIGTKDEKTTKWDGVENMCPPLYDHSVDTRSWGICSCWENGARRGDHKRSTPGCLEANPNYDDLDSTTPTTEREDLNVPKNKDGQMCPIPDDNKYYPCVRSSDGVCGEILIPVSGTSKDEMTFDSKFKKALNDDKIITDATRDGCPSDEHCPEKTTDGYEYECKTNGVPATVPGYKYRTRITN
jgi:hypothetical protein